MLKLKEVLIERNISQRQLALKLGVSPTTLSKLIMHNYWSVGDVEKFKQKLTACLVEFGINHPIDELLKVETTAESLTTDAVVSAPKTTKEIKEDIMLLAKQALFPATKRHFSLIRDPFAEDIRSADEVFLPPMCVMCAKPCSKLPNTADLWQLSAKAGRVNQPYGAIYSTALTKKTHRLWRLSLTSSRWKTTI